MSKILTAKQILKTTEQYNQTYNISQEEIQCGYLGRNIAYRITRDNQFYEVSVEGLDEDGELLLFNHFNRLFPDKDEAEQYVFDLKNKMVVNHPRLKSVGLNCEV